MEEKFSTLRTHFKSELQTLKDSKEVESLKLKFFGKKGVFADLMSQLRNCAPEARPEMGKQVNLLKEELTLLCEQALEGFQKAELSRQMAEERIDIALPGRRTFCGKKHPIIQTIDEFLEIFKEMGFSVQYGPDIDSDYYNYEGLNFPEDHPARDMQDTFYISSDKLLRSHTSNTQLRVMEATTPPIRIVAPGTVFRNEDISARSHVFFHQIEGLYVDRAVSFADLISTMQEVWDKFFRKPIETRFRPSFFPFVEPGLEVDIRCIQCEGKGCRLCKETGWLEVAGAGMVHPEVLRNGGIDPEEYTGYAWGLGIERLAMLRYGVKDIRLFSENDFRFLAGF